MATFSDTDENWRFDILNRGRPPCQNRSDPEKLKAEDLDPAGLETCNPAIRSHKDCG